MARSASFTEAEAAAAPAEVADTVRIWVEEVLLPTYLVGEPDRNPMFLEKRVYQGSSGRVYPYPVIDKISDEKVEEWHRVVFLENRYLKLMVMPGFGGRIQSAYDKTNGYPFIYHNRVIKPALVGLTGPWLSGGIEFNWPQHHRPGTYCPVDYKIATNKAGSGTLWLSQIEPMWHLKCTLGLTLHPDIAVVEIYTRLFNPTPLPQSFHLWTNLAVHVNEHHQAVFPPDVQAVYDHGKRDVSAFPIARGTYYKVDYSRGVDISWYKNLPVPTSYMAAKSKYDFIGGYDHRRQAGVLHVADHHVVPGKKLWVWGGGDFGRAWGRNLTDEDGPYAELMCGVFADNQPDFCWLAPFEEKEARQLVYPYRAIGCVRNATGDAAVSLDITRSKARFGVYATSEWRRAWVCLRQLGKPLWEKTVDLAPETPLLAEARLPRHCLPEHLRLWVVSAEGEDLVTYSPEPPRAEPIPEPAQAIPEPAKVGSAEALYLAGLHLEQYRHATREPEDYYREALRRDPTDVRNNNALGLLLLRRGQFAKAEPFFRAAIRTQTRHNPNPPDGEPHYYLGVCLRYLDRPEEAHDAFYKATWSGAWQKAAFFQLAQLAAPHADVFKALEFATGAVGRDFHNPKATHLQMMLLRKRGLAEAALRLAEAALNTDPLDFGARNERLLLLRPEDPGQAREELAALLESMRHDPHTHLELAADYAHAGAFEEAIDVLGRVAPPPSTALSAHLEQITVLPDAALQASPGTQSVLGTLRVPGHLGPAALPNLRPMVLYFLGYYSFCRGDSRGAFGYWLRAAEQKPERCFPNSLDSILALRAALLYLGDDARTLFYLGNLWYDKRQVAEATACWEASRRADRTFPTVQRNLALVYFNKQHDPGKALKALEKAFELDPTDARVLFELDLLKRRARVAPEQRFTFLQRHRQVVEQREDLLLEFVTLLNFSGQHQAALEILLARKFHPWEGGEGKVTGQYVVSLVELAKQRLCAPSGSAGLRTGAAARQALELLERARCYPHTLGEGKLDGTQENHILYWLGVAYEESGDLAAAKRCWAEAAIGRSEPAPAIYYNDPNPETIFYQGLALQKLGRGAAARARFRTLINFGQQHLRDQPVIDYFAVSLPEFQVFDDDLARRNQIHCRYLMGLGLLGLGKREQALKELRRVLQLDPSHLRARLHLRLLPFLRRPARLRRN